MEAPPGLYVTWDASEVDDSAFLRYNVYRRTPDESEWTLIKEITNKGVNFYQDYLVKSGQSYVYSITQTANIGGEEVESEHPTSVSGSVTYLDTFIHAVQRPDIYTQVFTEERTIQIMQETRFLQSWSRIKPVAHVGHSEGRQIILQTRLGWDIYEEIWNATVDVFSSQRTRGSVLCLRGEDGSLFYCQMTNPMRSDQKMIAAPILTFQEVHWIEGV